MLQDCADAHNVRAHLRADLFLGHKLLVHGEGWMDDEGVRIADIAKVHRPAAFVDEFLCCVQARANSEVQRFAKAAAQVFLCKSVEGIDRNARVFHLLGLRTHLRSASEPERCAHIALWLRERRRGICSYSYVPDDFAVSGWLQYHGHALVERFDADCYRSLLDAMDTHDLARGRDRYPEALAEIWQPVLVGLIGSDALNVPEGQRALTAQLRHLRLAKVDSIRGGDGFLNDAARFGRKIARLLCLSAACALRSCS